MVSSETVKDRLKRSLGNKIHIKKIHIKIHIKIYINIKIIYVNISSYIY
jgi:hypothetical protein